MTIPDVDNDQRSVGELILDADITSRDALWDSGKDLAKARVRSWGEVVEAAADLWSAMPDRLGDPTMSRIRTLSDGLQRTQRRTQWPGAGDGDPHLESVATSLGRAAELVSAVDRGGASRNLSAPMPIDVLHDAEAARTRLMHVVYVCAHSVGTSLDRHVEELRGTLDQRKSLDRGDSFTRAQAARQRIGAAERIAGAYVGSRWPQALTGEHRGPVEAARLERALARWDVQAHRTLAGPPTAANVLRIVQVQREITSAADVVGSVAARRGLTDLEQHHFRTRPALASLQQVWGRVAADLQPMLVRQRRVDPALLGAANEVHAALREITHEGAGYATPDDVIARVDVLGATASLHRALASTVDLAHVVGDVVADPAFTVSARGAQALVTAGGVPVGNHHGMSLADVHHNRDIPIPQPARVVLAADLDQVIRVAVAADSAGATRPEIRAQLDPPTAPSGRLHQDRALASTRPAAAPGFGCER